MDITMIWALGASGMLYYMLSRSLHMISEGRRDPPFGWILTASVFWFVSFPIVLYSHIKKGF